MFSRKRPPQLSVLEELQQTYNDVTNLTIKNLTLEEDGKLEQALKGWKSLHTLLLFKVDVFEKTAKLTAEELAILVELHGIREENVKHLVRIQLRLDEQQRRRKHLAEWQAQNQLQQQSQPPQQSQPSQPTKQKYMTSLRSGPSRSLNGSSRQMQRLLRPYKLLTQSRDQVQAAVSKSWNRPRQPQKSLTPEISQLLFEDFDQAVPAERINSRLSDSSAYSENLIELDDNDDLNFYDNSLSRLLEDLSLDPKRLLQPPPKTPLSHPSKSTSDVPTLAPMKSPPAVYTQTVPQTIVSPPSLSGSQAVPASTAAQPKKYVYTQPQRIDVKKMMQASLSRQSIPKAAPKPAAKPAPKPVVKPQPKPAPKPKQATKPARNITYQYKPLEKPKPKPRVTKKPAEELPLLPTMDDILGGYDADSSVFENQDIRQVENETSSDEAEQEAIIKLIKGIDELAARQILNDIVVRGDEVYWDDIVGLETAKYSLKEAVVYPFLRPDLFRGLREPTRGMLLFGPPGTGKTMLARAVATESKLTFFSISSSSLTSKYLGESEKLVKALFMLAKKLSPLIVFIDEIDSLLGTRTEGEVESMRRIKNEFLVQWSELLSAAAGRENSADVSRVLILGATNLPWGIDDAARRRFAKRVYIPLPEDETRKLQLVKLLQWQNHTMLDADFEELVGLTEGFSGSDITLLAKDSAMGPLRLLGDKLLSTPTEEIRPIQLSDFVESLKYIRPSVSKEGLGEYEKWLAKFGSSGA